MDLSNLGSLNPTATQEELAENGSGIGDMWLAPLPLRND